MHGRFWLLTLLAVSLSFTLVLLVQPGPLLAQQRRAKSLVEPSPQAAPDAVGKSPVNFGRRSRLLALAPDASWVAAADNGQIRVWETKTGRTLAMIGEKNREWNSGGAILASPDGRWLVDTGVLPGSVLSARVYDTRTWKLSRRISPRFNGNKRVHEGILHGAFSGDNRLAFSLDGSPHAIAVFDPATGKTLQTISREKFETTMGAIAFIDDGSRLLFIAGEFSYAPTPDPPRWRTYDFETGELADWDKLPFIQNYWEVAFADELVASLDQGYYTAFNQSAMNDGPAKAFDFPINHESVTGLAVSWKGQYLATINKSGLVEVRNVRTRRLVTPNLHGR